MDAIIPYSKAECMLFTRVINQKLPRELRDLIYEKCWANALGKDGKDTHPWKLSLQYRDDVGFYRPSLRPSWPHFVSPDFVGLQAAKEAAQVFYRTSNPIIDKGDISRFFIIDLFDLDIIPAEHLTAVVFKIEGPYTRWEQDVKTRWRSTVDALSSIPKFQTGFPRVKVEISTHGSMSEIFPVFCVAQDMHKELKSRGAVMECEHIPGYAREIGEVRFRVNPLFALSREDWAGYYVNELGKLLPAAYYLQVRENIVKDLKRWQRVV